MNIILIIIFLSNTPLMLFPNFIQSDILLLIKVRISLFCHLVLRHICRYICIIIKTIKHGQMHTFYKHARFSNLRIPINSQQSALLFSGRCDIGYSISTSSFEIKCTSKEELISFLCPYLNRTKNFFFPNTPLAHPTTSFIILLLLPSPPTPELWPLQQTSPRF